VTGEGYLDLATTIASTNLLSRLLLKTGSTSALLSPNDTGTNKATQVQIRDLMLDCNGLAFGAVNLPDQGSAFGRFWTLERVYATNMSGGSSICIYVGVGNAGCNFRDCYIYNGQSGSAAGYNGLVVNGTDCNVDHCWIGFWGTYGFLLDGGAAGMSCFVKGGGIFGNGFAGIGVLGEGLLLDGVSIDGNQQLGVYVAYGASPPTTIVNCYFHGNGQSSNNTGPNIYVANNNLVLNLFNNVSFYDGTANLPNYMVSVGGTGCQVNMAGNYAPVSQFGTAYTNYTGSAYDQTPSYLGGCLVDTEQFVALTAAYTLTSQTTLQKLFNATANGTLTVPAATSYFFQCSFDLTAMSGTTGTFSFGFGGTATLTSVRYVSMAQKADAVNTAPPVTPQMVTGTQAAAVVLVATSTTTTGGAFIEGIIRINAAGTLIPEVAISVATTAIVSTGSWFRIWPVGSNTVTNVGNWS
jgi:hypothetical protein